MASPVGLYDILGINGQTWLCSAQKLFVKRVLFCLKQLNLPDFNLLLTLSVIFAEGRFFYFTVTVT